MIGISHSAHLHLFFSEYIRAVFRTYASYTVMQLKASGTLDSLLSIGMQSGMLEEAYALLCNCDLVL